MKSVKILMEKAFKSNGTDGVRLQRNRVRNAIESVCQTYLLDFDDALTFEALPSALDDTLAVIEEPALTAKYDFYQESETIFKARLKDLGMI